MDSCTFCRVSLLPDLASFTSITLHVRVVLKSQYMFLIRAKPSPATQNVKKRVFPLYFPDIPYFLPQCKCFDGRMLHPFAVVGLNPGVRCCVFLISHSIKFNNNFILLTPMKSRNTHPLKGISVETPLTILHLNCCHARMIYSFVPSSLNGCRFGIWGRGLNTCSVYGNPRFWKKKSEWICM